MPRKPRIEFAGALYHVIARGNHNKKVFWEKSDYEDYLARLWNYHSKFGFILYSYCLMPNHIHLLIETNKIPLSKIMQAIQFSYTQSFNRRHRKIGHLFHGRYKAILCDKDEYLFQLIRYIHNNPVRARLVNNPKSYQWSSHRTILGLDKSGRCDVKFVLKQFGSSKRVAVRNYEKFILDAIGVGHKKEYYLLKDQRILGEDEFVDSALSHANCEKEVCYYDVSLPELIGVVSKEFNISKDEIVSRGRGRKGSLGREVVIYLAKNITGETFAKMARFFSRSCAAMTIKYRVIEERIKNNNSFANKIKKATDAAIFGKSVRYLQNLIT